MTLQYLQAADCYSVLISPLAPPLSLVTDTNDFVEDGWMDGWMDGCAHPLSLAMSPLAIYLCHYQDNTIIRRMSLPEQCRHHYGKYLTRTISLPEHRHDQENYMTRTMSLPGHRYNPGNVTTRT